MDLLADEPLLDVVSAPEAAGPGAYLDNAATTPALASTVGRVLLLLPWYGSVHRGAGVRSRVSTEAYESARATVHRLVGARADQAVVFVRNSTDALNKVARRLLAQHGPETVVVTTEAEHHANLLPWRWMQVRHVGLHADGTPDVDQLEALLAAERGRVRLVSVHGASNVTGHVPDLALWARLAHDAGAELLVDAAQLAPHRALELAALGVDHCAFSGHKLFAPFGSGVLVSPVGFFEAGPPDVWGGGATADVSLDGVEWNCAPTRDEAGSPNVLGAVSLASSLETLHRIGFDRLRLHEAALVARLDAALDAVPAVRRPPRPAGDRVGVQVFAVEGWRGHDVAQRLADDHGVAVRAGRFCAHPLVGQLNAGLGLAGDAALVRVSLAGCSASGEIDRLGAGLAAIAAGAGAAAGPSRAIR